MDQPERVTNSPLEHHRPHSMAPGGKEDKQKTLACDQGNNPGVLSDRDWASPPPRPPPLVKSQETLGHKSPPLPQLWRHLQAYLLFQEWLDKFLVVSLWGQLSILLLTGSLGEQVLEPQACLGAELGFRPRLCLHRLRDKPGDRHLPHSAQTV